MRGIERRELRRGWTTGACATAAAKAAYWALLAGDFPDPVEINLPKGQKVAFALGLESRGGDWAEVGIVKDAGDDPDVTHGATIIARVRRLADAEGVVFRAGVGVGTVTLEGLPIPPGEPAINPVPRRMIEAALAEVAAVLRASGGVEVTISIPGGEDLARQTMNGRLGILGGLSILGTTGIVIPYSCSSWIHSIHRGIDVARALGLEHIGAATGRTSEDALRGRHGFREQALIDMGDFAGGVLKYLRDHPVPRLSLAGGFGKLSKLAAGHLDLHSSHSSVDTGFLAELTLRAGAGDDVAAEIEAATSAARALAAAKGVPLADSVARAARRTALATLAGGVAVEVVVYDRQGSEVGHAGFG